MSVTAAELLIKIRAIIDGAKNIADVQAGLNGIEAEAHQASGATDILQSALKKLAGVLAGAFALNQAQAFASTLISLSDEYTRLTGKLNLTTDSAEEQKAVLAELRKISDDVGVSTAEMATTFSRMKIATDSAGGSTAQMLDLTESLSKSLAIGSAQVSETTSVLRQFSQAMGKGVLNGDEFNSLVENAPALMNAVAESLGTVTGALREQSQAGELSSTRIANAILEQGNAIDEQFASLPKTIEQASQRVSNAFLEIVGQTDQATGASRALVGVLSSVAGNLESLATGALALAGVGAAKLAQSLISTVAASRAAATAAAATAAANAQATAAAQAHAAAQLQVARAVLAAEIQFNAVAASLGRSTAATLASVQAARANATAMAANAAALSTVAPAATAAATAMKLFNASLVLAAGAIGGFTLGNMLNEFEAVRGTAIQVVGQFERLAAGVRLAGEVLSSAFDPQRTVRALKDYDEAIRQINISTAAATQRTIANTKANKDGRSEVELFTDSVAKHAQRQVEASAKITAAAKAQAGVQIAVAEQLLAAARTEQEVAKATIALAQAKAVALQAVATAAQAEAEAAQAVVKAVEDENKARGKNTEITQAAIDTAKAEANAKAEQAAKSQAAADAAKKQAGVQTELNDVNRVAAALAGDVAAKTAQQAQSARELAEIEAQIVATKLRASGLVIAARDAEAKILRDSIELRKREAAAIKESLAAEERELAILKQQAPIEAQRTEEQRKAIEAQEAKVEALKKGEAQARLEVEATKASAAAANEQAAANTTATASIQERTAAEKAAAEAAGKDAFEVGRLAAKTQDVAKAKELDAIATERVKAENDAFFEGIRGAANAIAEYIDGMSRMAFAGLQASGSVDIAAASFDKLFKALIEPSLGFRQLFFNIHKAAQEAVTQAENQESAYRRLFAEIDNGALSMRELDTAQRFVETSAIAANDAGLGIVHGLGLIDKSRLDNLIGQINAARSAMQGLLAATQDQIFAEEQRRRRLQGDDLAAKQAEFARQEAELRKEIAAQQDQDLKRALQERLDLLSKNNKLELNQLREKETERKTIEREAEAERKQRDADRQQQEQSDTTQPTPPRQRPTAPTPEAPPTPPRQRPTAPSPEAPTAPPRQRDIEAEDAAQEIAHQRQLARIEQQRRALEGLRQGGLALNIGALTPEELITPEAVRRLVEPVLRERAGLRR